MSTTKGLVAKGATLVRRHQRLLWWIWAVSLILAILGAVPTHMMTARTLDSSLASSLIAGRFHVASWIELLMQPEIQIPPLTWASVGMQVVFFFYIMFVTGGILVVYREDRKLSKAEFFENCGLYFWRFFRLALISIIPFGLCLALYNGVVTKISDKVAQASPYESHEFWTRMAGGIIVLLLILWTRLWFDVAQVRAVAQNERGMWRNTFRAFKITWNALGRLLWMYFRISLVAWATLLLGFWIWLHIPGRAFFLSFLLVQLVLLVQVAVRLWQRASAITWYREYAEEHPAAVVEYTTPPPTQIVDAPAGSQ